MKGYVEKTNGYRFKGTRVSLDSIVYAFWRGETAESIAQSFPTLSLEQVYGGLAYYLAHRGEIDEYLRKEEQAYDVLRQSAREQDPMFYKKIASHKQSV